MARIKIVTLYNVCTPATGTPTPWADPAGGGGAQPQRK